MPQARKKESAEDRSRRFQRRAVEESYLALRQKCLGVIRSNPEVLPQVWRTICAAGFGDADEDLAGTKTKHAVKTLVKQEPDQESCKGEPNDSLCASTSNTGGSHGSVNSFEGGEQPPADGHRNYGTLRSMPVKYIQEALTAAEPAVLSKNNLQNLVRPGKRTFDRNDLNEIAEFISGVDPDLLIPPHACNMAGLRSMISERNKSLGRRAKEMTLPIDWQAEGVYRVQRESNGGYSLRNVFSQKMAQIPSDLLCECGGLDDTLKIEGNFSEARASILWENSGDRIGYCTQFLPLGPLVMPAPVKRQKLNMVKQAPTKQEQVNQTPTKAKTEPDLLDSIKVQVKRDAVAAIAQGEHAELCQATLLDEETDGDGDTLLDSGALAGSSQSGDQVAPKLEETKEEPGSMPEEYVPPMPSSDAYM